MLAVHKSAGRAEERAQRVLWPLRKILERPEIRMNPTGR